MKKLETFYIWRDGQENITGFRSKELAIKFAKEKKIEIYNIGKEITMIR